MQCEECYIFCFCYCFLFFLSFFLFLCYFICFTRTGRMLTLPNLWSDLLFPADISFTHTEQVYDIIDERHVESGKRMLTGQFEKLWRIQFYDEPLSDLLIVSRNIFTPYLLSTDIYWRASCTRIILRWTDVKQRSHDSSLGDAN